MEGCFEIQTNAPLLTRLKKIMANATVKDPNQLSKEPDYSE